MQGYRTNLAFCHVCWLSSKLKVLICKDFMSIATLVTSLALLTASPVIPADSVPPAHVVAQKSGDPVEVAFAPYRSNCPDYYSTEGLTDTPKGLRTLQAVNRLRRGMTVQQVLQQVGRVDRPYDGYQQTNATQGRIIWAGMQQGDSVLGYRIYAMFTVRSGRPVLTGATLDIDHANGTCAYSRGF